MKNLILIGAGGHCVSCIDVIEKEKKFKIVGVLDKKKSRNIKYKILSKDENFKKIILKCKNILITLGQIKQTDKRVDLFNKAKKIGFKFPKVISPLAYVSKNAVVGEGSIIMHGAIVNAGAKIGKNCIINTNALIEHDAKIGDHCHVSTRATLNGGVELGKKSFVGSHSVVRQNIKIGQGSFVNANLFINKNLEKNSSVYEKV